MVMSILSVLPSVAVAVMPKYNLGDTSDGLPVIWQVILPASLKTATVSPIGRAGLAVQPPIALTSRPVLVKVSGVIAVPIV